MTMTALTGLGAVGRAVKDTATPPMMKLANILPDPDNPREPFGKRSPEDQQKQLALNENVGLRGVKSPVSLRPHPTLPGKFFINHGHCRCEAAEVNAQPEVPYFLDLDFSDYDQVNENELRANLSPWSLAAFIAKKLQAGESKGDIAAGLHKHQNAVTEYLALVDAPVCLHAAYAAGVKSPRTLYDLRRAWDEFPDAVEAWTGSGAKITRDTIKELLQSLRHDVIAPPAGDATAPVLLVDAHEDVLRVANSHEQGTPANDPVGTGLVETPPVAAPTSAPAASPAKQVGTIELRHEETPPARTPPTKEASELRRDVKPPASSQAKSTPPLTLEELGPRIAVEYKGVPATIAARTTVKVLFPGAGIEVEVLMSEVVVVK